MKAKSMDALMAQKTESEKDLLNIPGVNAVDVGYKYVDGKRTDEVVIRVHVGKKKKNVPKDEMIPAEINGVKTDVIEGTYDAQLVSKEAINVDAQSDTGRYRPLKGGISIGPDRSVGGFVYAGTLGCFVKDNATGKTLMLSNFHVMCIDNSWHVGDKQNQPSLIDTGTHADTVGTINRAILSAHVDGAVANINAGISAVASIVDIGNVQGTTAAVLGAAVRKRGRTTLLTYGSIDGLNATVNVNYGGTIGTKTLTNQITIKADAAHNAMFSDHGDSGSAIVDAGNKVVALLFAGSGSRTIGNPIGFVETELKVTVLKYVVKKLEIKEVKNEKLEIKEFKELKQEKLEIIEQLKLVNELNKINEVSNPIFPNLPITHQSDSGLEQRIQQLESVVSGLSSFIESGLRPDLSEGALSNE